MLDNPEIRLGQLKRPDNKLYNPNRLLRKILKIAQIISNNHLPIHRIIDNPQILVNLTHPSNPTNHWQDHNHQQLQAHDPVLHAGQLRRGEQLR
jgi:hypothetical protein